MEPLAFRPHPWHGIDPGPRCPDLRHYFLTYKTMRGETRSRISVDPVYGAAAARAIVEAARGDYSGQFGAFAP